LNRRKKAGHARLACENFFFAKVKLTFAVGFTNSPRQKKPKAKVNKTQKQKLH